MIRSWYLAGFVAMTIALQVDCRATEKEKPAGKESAPNNVFSYDDYQAVLTGFVRDGKVNYAALKADSKASSRLRKFIEQIAKFDPSTLQSRDEARAFWINAYNALVLDGVLRRYPLETLRPKRLNGTYDDSFYSAATFVLGGTKKSLKEIEEHLRRTYADPQFHFALVCGAAGGPPLRDKVYTAAALDEQLNEATREFLKRPENFRFDQTASKLQLSQLFEWYRQEFEDDAGGSVVDWLQDQLEPETARAIKSLTPGNISYTSFDWRLNATLHR